MRLSSRPLMGPGRRPRPMPARIREASPARPGERVCSSPACRPAPPALTPNAGLCASTLIPRGCAAPHRYPPGLVHRQQVVRACDRNGNIRPAGDPLCAAAILPAAGLEPRPAIPRLPGSFSITNLSPARSRQEPGNGGQQNQHRLIPGNRLAKIAMFTLLPLFRPANGAYGRSEGNSVMPVLAGLAVLVHTSSRAGRRGPSLADETMVKQWYDFDRGPAGPGPAGP